MAEHELVEQVRADEETALRRLGSDKYLVAATEARLDEPSVLRTVARDAASGSAVFDDWAGAEAGDIAAAFESAAEAEREHYERVAALLDGDPDPGGAVHESLLEADDTAERLGAAIGRALVLDRTLLQVVNFFVSEGDRERADLARELREAAGDRLDEWTALTDGAIDAGDDHERAREAAEAVIRRAYEEYASALEAMDVDPAPVC